MRVIQYFLLGVLLTVSVNSLPCILPSCNASDPKLDQVITAIEAGGGGGGGGGQVQITDASKNPVIIPTDGSNFYLGVMPFFSDGTQFQQGGGSPTHALRVTLAGTPTVVVAPQGYTYADTSGTITAGGVAQALSVSGQSLVKIQNLDTAEDLWINDTSGTAAVNTPGSFKLVAGGYYETDSNAAISVVATTTGHKFTATYR